MPALIFNIRHQRINRVDCFLPVRYSKNYLYAEFNFLTQDWEGVSKTAVFKSQKYSIPVVLGESDTCLVPHEVLEETKFSVSVFGGNLITVDSEEVKVFESGYRSDLVEPPTPDVYTQILTSLNGKADDLRYENNILYLMANKNTIASVKIVAGSGGSGSDGREVELRSNGEYIQWRYSGEEDWTNLVALADLKGEKGDNYILTEEDIEEIASKVKVATSADKITYDDTETQLGATNVQDAIGQLSEQIVDLKENGITGGGTSTGLSSEIKSALMTVVENIGLWKDGNGQTYIDNLRKALYNAPLSSITVVYTQSKAVLPTDELETLKGDLVVTGHYTDGSSAVVTDYTLSGSLVAGTSTITVTKDGFTATFEVTVSEGEVKATGITLDKTTLSFTGKTPIQLTATVTPSNSTDAVVWRSSENAVATVENGLVTPVADGSCVIYATAGDVTAECSVSVALPLSGNNIGNPYLNYVNSDPTTLGKTDEELKDKWYRCSYNNWYNALGASHTVFLHPFTDGTFYIRTVTRSSSPYIYFDAFENADIVANPTATLGRVGDVFTDATVTEIKGFDWIDYEGNAKTGIVDLGEWEYADGSGQTYGGAMLQLRKIVVPKDVYVFMTYGENLNASQWPTTNENYPINDLYTIFDSDPSANILQVVE